MIHFGSNLLIQMYVLICYVEFFVQALAILSIFGNYDSNSDVHHLQCLRLLVGLVGSCLRALVEGDAEIFYPTLQQARQV